MHLYATYYYRRATALRPYDSRMWWVMNPGCVFNFVLYLSKCSFIIICDSVSRQVCNGPLFWAFGTTSRGYTGIVLFFIQLSIGLRGIILACCSPNYNHCSIVIIAVSWYNTYVYLFIFRFSRKRRETIILDLPYRIYPPSYCQARICIPPMLALHSYCCNYIFNAFLCAHARAIIGLWACSGKWRSRGSCNEPIG